MAVQQCRHGKARTRKRASHHALPQRHLAKCGRCGAIIRPHTVCGNCGSYRGVVIVDMETEETA
ncbi:50S ribosomal protein L32 [Planctomycetota bacterium]